MNIGPYEVISEIGRGGMGVVYKAIDPKTNQIVAIKMLRATGALSRHGRIGLVREARTTGDLQHPNIVKVHDIGQHKGLLYIVMEYLDGRSLDHTVKHRVTMTVPERLQIILQLCAGLGYAHAQGVIHRDIKPANIFLLRNGVVKVVDFGLARLTELTWSTKSQFAGTLLYMSPEQLNGTPPGPRSDIWSAGVTLYELLNHRMPFNTSNVGSMINSIRNDPPAPMDSSLMFSAELNVVVHRALAKSPDNRYKAIEDLAIDIKNILSPASSEGGNLATQEVSSDESRVDTLFLGASRYVAPDLGYHNRLQGRVAFERRGFNFRSGFLERVNQFLVRVDRHHFRMGCLIIGLPSLSLFLLGAWGFIASGANLDLFGAEMIGTGALLVISGIGTFVIVMGRAGVTFPRRCRTCAYQHMRRVSRWSRFVTSNSEIELGLNDCVTALQQGFFEDAAKLLCVHGSETDAIYTVIRYNLEYCECPKCFDQSALIIVDDRIDQRWQRRNEYMESYKYGSIRGNQTA